MEAGGASGGASSSVSAAGVAEEGVEFDFDQLAQRQPALGQGAAPAGEDRERGRAVAQAAKHHVAPGLDALRDRDFVLTLEQFGAAHLAQEHPHRVVAAAEIGGREVAAIAALRRGRFGAGGLGVWLDLGHGLGRAVRVDQFDTEFPQQRDGVFQFLCVFAGLGQGRVQLLARHHAARHRARDQVRERRPGDPDRGPVLRLAAFHYCRDCDRSVHLSPCSISAAAAAAVCAPPERPPPAARRGGEGEQTGREEGHPGEACHICDISPRSHTPHVATQMPILWGAARSAETSTRAP